MAVFDRPDDVRRPSPEGEAQARLAREDQRRGPGAGGANCRGPAEADLDGAGGAAREDLEHRQLAAANLPADHFVASSPPDDLPGDERFPGPADRDDRVAAVPGPADAQGPADRPLYVGSVRPSKGVTRYAVHRGNGDPAVPLRRR